MLARNFFCVTALTLSSALCAQTTPAPTAAAPSAFTPTHITVRAGGSGPDVILIPGLASPREVWRAELPKLLPHYHVHLVQVDGFAGSPAGANAAMNAGLLDAIVADLAQYIEANKLQSPAIIGHSLGGLLALDLAEKHPGDVGKILIVDSLPYFGALLNQTPNDVKDSARQSRSQIEEQSKDQQLHGAVAYGQGAATKKDDQDHIALWSANTNPHVMGEAMYEDMVTDLQPELGKVTAPITILWPYSTDEGSASAKEKQYASQYSKAPHVKLVKVDNSRHFIMLDQPDAFDKAVQEFLKT